METSHTGCMKNAGILKVQVFTEKSFWTDLNYFLEG